VTKENKNHYSTRREEEIYGENLNPNCAVRTEIVLGLEKISDRKSSEQPNNNGKEDRNSNSKKLSECGGGSNTKLCEKLTGFGRPRNRSDRAGGNVKASEQTEKGSGGNTRRTPGIAQDICAGSGEFGQRLQE